MGLQGLAVAAGVVEVAVGAAVAAVVGVVAAAEAAVFGAVAAVGNKQLDKKMKQIISSP